MDYRALFQGREFEVDGIVWTVEVENSPGARDNNNTDEIIFALALKNKNTGEARKLKLRASDAGLHNEHHMPALDQCVRMFLRGDDKVGNIGSASEMPPL
jgi:hypothetical protein